MKLNISNLLTLSRILVIPVIVACIYLKNPLYGWIAFVLFCAAGITDYFDGYIARLRNEVSNLGTFLDPIADKLLVAEVILILSSKDVIADWETIPALIILLRESQELSYELISRILELPLGRVKSRLNRGKMKLREILKEKGVTR